MKRREFITLHGGAAAAWPRAAHAQGTERVFRLGALSPAVAQLDSIRTIVLPELAKACIAEASWYDGTGHAPFLEWPERFNQELVSFARRLHG